MIKIENSRKLKVGVLTMHRVVNYGSYLQAYATQRVFESLGCECELIDYVYPNKWHYKNGLIKSRNIKVMIASVLTKFGFTFFNKMNSAIQKSAKKHYKLSSRTYKTPNQIQNNPPKYDIYVTGSDQTWNINHTKGDPTFLLSFAPESATRISFSASLANRGIDERYKAVFAQYLKQYNALSIRDKNGNKIIKEILGKEAKVTLDPTLMLTGEEWLEFADSENNAKDEVKFILLYMLSYAFEPRPYIYRLLEDLQKKTGFIIYSLSEIPEEYNLNYKLFTVIEPEMFIRLFSRASYVVTSSFHGTAFAVNFGIPLYSLIKHIDSDDDRQTTLLTNLNLTNCLVPINKSFNDIVPYYDVKDVNLKLEELRMDTFDFLRKNIQIS